MIFVLLIGILLLFLLNFLINKGDIFSPSCMVCAVYFICVSFALYNYDIWELQDFSGQTVSIVLASLLVFSIVSFFVCNVFYGRKRKRRAPLSPEECSIRYIRINKALLYGTILFQTLIIILSVINIMKFRGGVAGWAYILHQYKDMSALGEASMPGYVQWGIRIVTVMGYIYLFIFINNVVMTKKVRGHIVCLIPVLLHIVRSILTGSRYNMICVAVAGAYAFYILYQQKTGWRRTFKFKYIVWGAVGIITIMFLFVILKRAAGRTDNIDPIYYITMYTSGCVKLLDLYIQQPIAQSTIWGKETFSGINIFLANRGFGTIYDIGLEFRYIGGRNLGNVYGAIRRYYQDFGFQGALLLVGISSFIWSVIYSKLTYAVKRNRELLLIVFMYMVHALVIFPIDDKFYSNLVTPSFVIYCVLFIITYRIFVRKKKIKYFEV